MTYRIEHPLLDSCIPKSAKFIEYCKNERWGSMVFADARNT